MSLLPAPQRLLIGISGASGIPIAERLLQTLAADASLRLGLIVSRNAREVIRWESSGDWGSAPAQIESTLKARFHPRGEFRVYDETDMAADISSGSQRSKGMIICPCSMGTLAAIASGLTLNLIHRAASVMIKEQKPLILVPRESPLSAIHLENMLKLSRLGISIVPATTGFYHKPGSVQDMIDFVCARVLDRAGIEHNLSRRWRDSEEAAKIGEETNDGYSRIQGYME